MYVPASQITDGVNALNVRLTPIVWVLRTRVPPYSLRAPIQDTLRQLSAGLPVGTVRSMDEVMARSTASADFNTLLLTVFGAALLLAAIGLYGLVASPSSSRRRRSAFAWRSALRPARCRPA